MSLTPRKPKIQQEESLIVWSKIPEFSLYWNGSSFIIPYVEHYLNNIAGQVRDGYCSNNPGLKEELDIFIKQETNHSLYHLRFNKKFYDAGYVELEAVVEKIKRELRSLREERSLAFNTAYCAGFENIALFAAKYLFLKANDLFEGCDARGADLFLWHVAEEFEHRAVCHDAFLAVSGNYFMRIYGLIYAFLHIGGAFSHAAAVILERYRRELSPKERAESIRRERRLFRRQLFYVIPRALLLFVPGYNPAKHKVPQQVAQALEFYKDIQPTTDRFGFSARQTSPS